MKKRYALCIPARKLFYFNISECSISLINLITSYILFSYREFVAGPGQLYIYCPQSPTLLNYLVNRGKHPRSSPGMISSRRLSRSEGDLCDSLGKDVPDSPVCFRSNSGSEDSGVRVSMLSDDFILKSKVRIVFF